MFCPSELAEDRFQAVTERENKCALDHLRKDVLSFTLLCRRLICMAILIAQISVFEFWKS